MIAHPQSGRQDSNLRPPGPKPGAMTGLRYAPNESSSSIFNAHQPLLMLYLFFNQPFRFSSLPTSTLLRWERDYLRWSSLRYGTNPAVSHPFQPPRYCGGSGIRTRGTVTRTTV